VWCHIHSHLLLVLFAVGQILKTCNLSGIHVCRQSATVDLFPSPLSSAHPQHIQSATTEFAPTICTVRSSMRCCHAPPSPSFDEVTLYGLEERRSYRSCQHFMKVATVQELAEKKAELQRREAGVKGLINPSSQETRSVEELLSFIEAERQGGSKGRSRKKKPKKKREASLEQAPEVGTGVEASSRAPLSPPHPPTPPHPTPPHPTPPQGPLQDAKILWGGGSMEEDCEDT